MSAVEVVRGGVVESRHSVHVVVADQAGAAVATLGDEDRPTFYRSAAKPMQALPLVEEGLADRLSLTAAELALCCASHEGEPAHVEGARAILAKAGVDESMLRCGPHPPFSQSAARALAAAGEAALPIHNNCSGKHAGMLALAVGMGWDPADYHRAGHPVQKRMRREIERWSGLVGDEVRTGVDGCGVVCFAVPLRVMAASLARFAAASVVDDGPGRIVRAMTDHSFMLGGTGRTCTDVTAAAGGRVFVKVGAEGVYVAGVPDRGLGVAVKVEDGGRRGAEVALIQVLAELGVLTTAEVSALAGHARPDVLNTRGEVVREVRAAFSLAGRAAAGR